MRTKKSLGQHWLVNRGVIQKVVDVATPAPGITILEIGPGTGALTEPLLATGNRVVAVETDPEAIGVLQAKFETAIMSGQLLLVECDIAHWNQEDQKHVLGDYLIVANIPYYITGMILRKFLESSNQPIAMTLVMQREVAERIMARDNKQSLLSLSVHAYGNPSLAGIIRPGSFSPPPAVDSAILQISHISKNFFQQEPKIKESDFFDLLHLGFAHKRKKLVTNIKERYSKPRVVEALETMGLSPDIRAEDMILGQWRQLIVHLSN